MKPLAPLLSCLLFSSLFAAPDTPDATFTGNAGLLYNANTTGGVASVLVQPDGKILVGSNEMEITYGSTTVQTALTRFNPDGTVDTAFGADNESTGSDAGIFIDSNGWPEVHALGLQSDGKIIAAGDLQGFRIGTKASPTLEQFSSSILRFNPDGSIDTSFNTAGTVAAGGLNYIEDVTVDANDRVLCAGGFSGFRNTPSGPTIARHGLARLNADGSVDTGFQIDPHAFGVPSGASAVVGWFRRAITDSSGKIYAAGEISWGYTWPKPTVHVFARLFPDGTPDPSFAPAFTEVTDFVLEPDGKITAIGNDSGTPFFKRFNTDGSVDPSFNFPGGYTKWHARPLRRSPSGQYLLAVPSAAHQDKLIRVNSDGSIDPAFDPVTTSTGGNDGFFGTWDIGADGKIYSGCGTYGVDGVETHKIVAFEGDYAAGSAGTIRLELGSASVLENSGLFPIAVSRTGGSTGAASIDVTASSGSATAGADFTAVSTTVSWADGESGTKYVHVPVTNDGTQEGNEIFNVSISSPSGVGTTAPTAGSVTILDDDTPAAITAHPASQTQNAVQTATFSVGISSNAPVTFQWRKNGTDIPGATAQSYTTPALGMADSGSTYDVVIHSSAGSTTSNAATLTVLSPDGTPAPSWSSPNITSLRSPTSTADGISYLFRQQAYAPTVIYKFLADGTQDALFTSPTFTKNGGHSNLYSIAAAPDGKLYMLGNFDNVGGSPRPGIARLHADGSLDTSFAPDWEATHSAPGSEIFPTTNGVYLVLMSSNGSRGLARLTDTGSIDTSFKFSNSSIGNDFHSVRALQELADGRVIVGYLRGYGASVTSYGFTRLEADGDEDTTFSPITSTNGAVTNYPAAIAARADGSFFFATRNSIGLAKADGTLDTGFAAVSPTGGLIHDIALVKGKVIAAGAFTGIAGESVGRIARLNSDGSLDLSFPGGPGADNAIDHLNPLSDGTLLAAGFFDTFNTASYPSIVKLLMPDPAVELLTPAPVWESDGTLTVALRRLGSANTAISVDVASQSGTAAEGSDFTAVNTTVSWAAGDAADKTVTVTLTDDADAEGTETFTLALANPAGTSLVNSSITATIRDDDSVPTIDTQPSTASTLENGSATFSVSASSPLALTYQWFFNGNAINGATGGTLTINPATPADEGDYHVVVSTPHESVTSDTVQLELVPDPTLVSPLFTSPASAPASGTVSIVVPTTDGGAIIGGNFTDFGGAAALDYIAKVKEDGSVDPSFTPPALDGKVNDIAVDKNGNVFAVGNFTGRIVKLSPTGAEDTTFSTNRGTGGDDPAFAIGLFPDGAIAVAGDFDKWNGTIISAYNALNAHVVRLLADGTLTSTRYPNPGNSSNYALGSRELKILSDGRMLVSFYTTYSSYPKARLYHADGTESTGFSYPFNAQRVDDISEFADGNFLLAGNSSLYKVNHTGAVVATYSTAQGANTSAIQIDGKVIAASSVRRYLPNQQLDPIFNAASKFNGYVSSLALRPDGRLWAAGDFTQYDGTSYPCVVLLENHPIDLAIVSQPEQVVQDPGTTATFSIQAVGSSAISYQWHKNGTSLSDGGTIAGATTNTLIITNIAEANEGNYSCIVTNLSGNKTSDTASLIVLGAPEIVSISPNVNVIEGQSITLEVEALGAGSPSYQWQKNGSVMPGETAASLSFAPASADDSADYRVVITNGLGSITSDPVSVAVQVNEAAPHPNFTALTSSGSVKTILPLANGNLLVGGSFNSLSDGSSTSGSKLALISPEGTILSDSSLSANGTVEKLSLQSDGKILIAGNFSQVNGQSSSKAARLHTNLSYDSSFGPGSSSPGTARDILQDANGKILIAGDFGNWNSYPDSAHLVRLNNDGTHDTGFVSYANNRVKSIHPLSGGGYLIAGWFTDYNSNTQADGLARITPSGSIDASVLYNPGFFYAGKSLITSSGDVIALNDFQNPLKRYDSAGNQISSFWNNISTNGRSLALAEDTLGNILLGGNFTSVDSAESNRFVRVASDGTRDSSFYTGSGFDGDVEVITIAADGSIWVGGSFSTYNGQAYRALIRLKGAPSQTAYQIWATASNLPETLAGFDQDADGDGVDNGMEFLYGLDAMTPQAPPAWNPSSITQDGAAINSLDAGAGLDPAKNYRVITVRTPLDEKGLTVQLTSGTDLVNFDTNGVHALGTPVIDGDFQVQTYYLTPAVEDSPSLFFRLEITE